jgi:Ax21 family sulfation-dependent quorum factor
MKRSLVALMLLAAVPFAASAADGISYNYVEGGYIKTDVGGDADGWAVNGAFAIHPSFHVFGGYNDQKVDGFYGVDVNQWRLGVGYNHTLSPKVDLVSQLAYESADLGTPFGSYNYDGYTAEVGVRSALTPMLEGYAGAGYGDLEHSNGEFYAKLGTQVKFNQNWGVAGDVRFVSGDTQWFVGPRLTW